MDAMEGSSVSVPVCRCCAAEGAFKDIKTSYRWMGDEEVYGDMLRECFDVNLSCSEQGGICEVCITQLRNAANFKKQVLRTETQFKKHLQGKPFKTTQVKEEMSGFDENDSDDMDNVDDEDYVPEFDVPIKNESDSEEKPKKRSAKAANTRAKKSKSSDDSNVKSFVCTSGDRNVNKEVDNSGLTKHLAGLGDETQTKTETTYIETKQSGLGEEEKKVINKVLKDLGIHRPAIYKHRYNVHTILQNSNATPIGAHYAGTGFACGFCKKFFLKACELKSHTIAKHTKEKAKFVQKKSMCKFIVKLDITDLHCEICKTKFNIIEELIDHLNQMHDKCLYTDIKNQIVCFKLDDDTLKCMFCQIEYATFKPLLVHMNQHYKNYICEVCAAGFVNQAMLATHKPLHITGEFKCSSCGKLFETQSRLKQHERLHTQTGFKLKCFQCDQKFGSIKNKKDHMKTVHGAKYEYKCAACDKQFTNKSSLWAHKKRDHLLERKFECEHCDMRFFSKSEIDDHMGTHRQTRDYLCEVCCKAFKFKKTLRQHMRTHSNDRPSRSITVNASVNERLSGVGSRPFF